VLTLIGALCAVSVPAAFIAYRNYKSERDTFVGQRHSVPSSEAREKLPGLADLSFRLADGSVMRGWYAPPRNAAVVILLHGSSDDRRSMLPEAAILAHAGFGVVLFDWPGHGESEGAIDWGEGARQAVSRAIDWLGQKSEVSSTRIGAFGFSIGGYMLAGVAAREPRLSAIALSGTPGDLKEQTRWEHRRFGPVSRLPALLAIARSGMRLDPDVQPGVVVGKVAPRPLLLVGGSDDETVPPFMVRELYARASEPKELWIVEGAGHGGYALVAPEEYPRRLTSFFSKALLTHGAAPPLAPPE
jgi:dipeptidyl aminopeptidase/acylaminoacyl peptidase